MPAASRAKHSPILANRNSCPSGLIRLFLLCSHGVHKVEWKSRPSCQPWPTRLTTLSLSGRKERAQAAPHANRRPSKIRKASDNPSDNDLRQHQTGATYSATDIHLACGQSDLTRCHQTKPPGMAWRRSGVLILMQQQCAATGSFTKPPAGLPECALGPTASGVRSSEPDLGGSCISDEKRSRASRLIANRFALKGLYQPNSVTFTETVDVGFLRTLHRDVAELGLQPGPVSLRIALSDSFCSAPVELSARARWYSAISAGDKYLLPAMCGAPSAGDSSPGERPRRAWFARFEQPVQGAPAKCSNRTGCSRPQPTVSGRHPAGATCGDVPRTYAVLECVAAPDLGSVNQ